MRDRYYTCRDNVSLKVEIVLQTTKKIDSRDEIVYYLFKDADYISVKEFNKYFILLKEIRI